MVVVGSVISGSAECLVDIHGHKVKVISAILMVSFPPSTFSSLGPGQEGWTVEFNQAESQIGLF